MLELRRQAVHTLGIFTVPVILFFGKTISLFLIGSIALFFFILAVYKLEKTKREKNILLEEFAAVENFFEEKIYSKFERGESYPMKGAILFYVGAFLTVLIFPEQIAAAAIAVLAIGDSASTVVGKLYGEHLMFGSRTWEGSIAFLISSFAVLLIFVQPQRAFLAAVIGTLAEIIGFPDDNILIPLSVAMALAIF